MACTTIPDGDKTDRQQSENTDLRHYASTFPAVRTHHGMNNRIKRSYHAMMADWSQYAAPEKYTNSFADTGSYDFKIGVFAGSASNGLSAGS